MIDDDAGILDPCEKHLAQIEKVRRWVDKYGRPLDCVPITVPERLDAPEPQEPEVTCGLCGEGMALKYRATHARRAHDMKPGQITWKGDLPHPCPARGCKYAAASSAGLSQHTRHEHPKLKKPTSKTNAA